MGIFYDYVHAKDDVASTARISRGVVERRGDDFVSVKFVDPSIKLASALKLLKRGAAPYVITTTHFWPTEASKPRARESDAKPPSGFALDQRHRHDRSLRAQRPR